VLGVDLDGRANLERLVQTWAAEDPMMRHVHLEIVWDTGASAVVAPARGLVALAAWYRDWMGLWESYVFRVIEYRELGRWCSCPPMCWPEGRDGIAVEMRVFQIFRVRQGKIAVMRAFLSEGEAIEAAEETRP
jgi:hypothetical protein